MIRICDLWSTEGVQWKDANWTWSDCQLVQAICAIWGNTGQLWKDANWRWSECTGSITPVAQIGGNPPGVDATTLIQPWLEEPWNPYRTGSVDRKKLIRLICKVKETKFDEEKEMKDFKITVEDIRLVVKTVANIDLDMKLEE
jgi:hypothetical protein